MCILAHVFRSYDNRVPGAISPWPRFFVPQDSYIAFASSLEEEPYDENLKSRHRDHQKALDDTEIEDPPLGAPYRAEIPILPRPEIFLTAADGGQLTAELHD